MADLLACLAFHEADHLVQIGYIRKSQGHSALAG